MSKSPGYLKQLRIPREQKVTKLFEKEGGAILILEIIPVVFVIILGFFVSVKKPSFLIPSPNLIAGVNTIKQEDMEKYDLDGLCKFVSNMLYTAALLLLLRVILNTLGFNTLSILIIPILFLFLLICLIYANTGNRFKKGQHVRK